MARRRWREREAEESRSLAQVHAVARDGDDVEAPDLLPVGDDVEAIGAEVVDRREVPIPLVDDGDEFEVRGGWGRLSVRFGGRLLSEGRVPQANLKE